MSKNAYLILYNSFLFYFKSTFDLSARKKNRTYPAAAAAVAVVGLMATFRVDA